ncbi:asparaginase [Patescibacteria group bacterium]|nr:asparaginase [Patescibacteria group bacterium]MBU1672912.1 asparaginase [Patescibacteria group bacterium]MBU1963383.1 asparaginase [Patescibacteria group bacterium]
MAYKRSKILLIYCGGAKLPTADQKGLEKWVDGFIEIAMMADVKARFIYEGPGSEVGRDQLIQIIREIRKNYNKYDGFVITHGLDNLLLNSSLLSFLIQKSGKPIVWTSAPVIEAKMKAQKPIKKIFTQYQTLGIKANLINAVQSATIDFAGPCMMFGNRLLLPVRTMQGFDSNLNVFSSWQISDLGKIQFGIQLAPHASRRSKTKPSFSEEYEQDIKIIDPNLGLTPERVLTGEEKGIIIKSLSEDPEFLLEKIDKKVPILIYTQGQIKDSPKIISAQGYTFEAAQAKFMWAMAKTQSTRELKKIFKNNFIGEI